MSTLTSNRDIANTVTDLVAELRAGNEAQQKRIIDQTITLLYPHFRNWSPTFCRVSGDVTGNHKDDVINIVAERVLIVLRESLIPGKHANVSNWYSYLYGVSRYAVLAHFNSSKMTAASGQTALIRKQRHIAVTRGKLRAALGREPLDMEVIDAANIDMRERRSNPEKQGAIVDLADMEVILPTVDVADHDRAIETTDEQALLAPVEGRELIEFIIRDCSKVSNDLGTAARIWLGGMYAEPPVLGTSADVAAALDIGSSRASHLIAAARDLARDLTKRRFGITFPA